MVVFNLVFLSFIRHSSHFSCHHRLQSGLQQAYGLSRALLPQHHHDHVHNSPHSGGRFIIWLHPDVHSSTAAARGLGLQPRPGRHHNHHAVLNGRDAGQQSLLQHWDHRWGGLRQQNWKVFRCRCELITYMFWCCRFGSDHAGRSWRRGVNFGLSIVLLHHSSSSSTSPCTQCWTGWSGFQHLLREQERHIIRSQCSVRPAIYIC